MNDEEINTRISLRTFKQSDKKWRVEVLVEDEEAIPSLISVLKREFSSWHIREHLTIERREANLKKRRPKKHDGRFSVMSWNVNGLGGKYYSIKGALEKQGPTIIVFQETLRTVRNWQDEIGWFRIGRFAGFEKRMENLQASSMRGLAMAIDTKANLTLERIDVSKEVEGLMIFGKVSGFASKEKVIIGNVYIPCRARVATMKLIMNEIERIREKFRDDELIIVGDWNMKLKSLRDRLQREKVDQFMEIIEVKKRKTFHIRGIPKSDIDHAIQTMGAPKPKSRVLRQLGDSNHWPLLVWWNQAQVKQMSKRPQPPLRMNHAKINLYKDVIGFHNRFAELADMEESEIIEKFDETAWDVVKSCKATTGGMKETKTKNKTREALFLEKKDRKIVRSIRRLEKFQKLDHSEERAIKIDAKRKKLNKRLVKANRAAQYHWNQQFDRAIENRDPAGVFAWIERTACAKGLKGGRGPLKNERGQLVSDEKEKAEVCAKYFSEMAKDRSGKSKDPNSWRHVMNDEIREEVEFKLGDPNFSPNLERSKVQRKVDPDLTKEFRDFSKRCGIRKFSQDRLTKREEIIEEMARRKKILQFLSNPISESELTTFLKEIARRKSPGKDGVLNELLRTAMEEKLEKGKKIQSPLFGCIHRLINHAYTNGIVPESWETAIVTPVPKKGDMTDLNNYRGIALMSNMMKIINGIFAKRLMTAIMEYRLIDPAQVGFVNREEAVAQAKCLLEIIEQRRALGKQTILCFVDLAKAYDSVPHEGLLAKAERFGISGIALQWLREIYRNPKVSCRDGSGGFSRAQKYERGVRQGDPLSPALFDIFMDDLLSDELHQLGVRVEIDERYEGTDGFEMIAALLYADDIVMIAEEHIKLQAQCDILSKWCDDNEMKVNAGKCGILKIGQRNDVFGEATDEEITIQGKSIPCVDTYTYLGIEINQQIDRDEMVKRRVVATKAKINLYRRFLSSPMVPMQAKMTCIKAIIQPTVTYGGEIWGYHKTRAAIAERAINEAMRMCFRLPKSTSTFIMRNEFKLRTIHEIACVAKTRLQYKTQILHGLLPKVRSRPIGLKHWIRGMKRPDRIQEKAWMNKMKIAQRLKDEKLEIEFKIAELDKKKSLTAKDRAALRILEQKLDNLVHDGIRRLVAEKLDKGPNPESANETRYVLTSGASVTHRLLRGWETERTDLAYGWTILERLRMGRYWNGQKLARCGLIETRFCDRCPFCKRGMPETDAHWVFECPVWAEWRKETLESIRARDEKASAGLTEDTKLFISMLMGANTLDTIGIRNDRLEARALGLLDGSVDSVEWRYETATKLAQFLARVSIERFNKLRAKERFLKLPVQ